MKADRVLETCLYAENLEETAAFYGRVLGLNSFAQVNQRHVFFRCGDAVLLLFNPAQTTSSTGDVPAHGAFGSGHVAFAMAPLAADQWRAHLRSHGVDIEAEIQWPAGGQSLYFRDPAGNSVELTTPKTWGMEEQTLDIPAHYDRILGLLPVGVCFVIPETGEILLANDAAAYILDATEAQELVGRSVLEYVQPQRRQEIGDFYRHVAGMAVVPEFFHERLELADGQQVDLEIAAGYLELAGRPIVQITFRDITDRARAEEAVRESEALFRRLAETTEAAIFLFRGDHNLHVNQAACRITGYEYDELVAMPFWQVLHPDFWEMVRERGMARQQGEPVPSRYEVAILTKSGEIRWLQYSGNLIDYKGQPAVLGTAIDITDRKEVEYQLQESEARFRALAQVSPASITLHLDGFLIYANPATTRHTGYSEEELKATDTWTLLSPDSVADMRRAYERMQKGESLSGVRLQIIAKDGSFRWMQINESPIELQGRAGTVITAYDITSLVEIEQEALANARRLEELSRRLVQVQERERRAIARELHDEVGQTLTALSIHLDLASRAGSEGQSAWLAESRRLVDELADQVRQMSLDLRPPMLDDLGLLPALLWCFERIGQQYRVTISFDHHGIEQRRFEADIETAIFRIVQEALTNVARHAAVQEASVRLWADAATISAQIEDKGQGFDPDTVLGFTNTTTSGLRGIRERVQLLGGRLIIEARPGCGACLTALLPLLGNGSTVDRG